MREESPEEIRYRRLRRDIVTYYAKLSQILVALPLRIVLPNIIDGLSKPPYAVLSVDRARDLIKDEPLPSDVVHRIGQALLAWTVAYELGTTVQRNGVSPWRLDGIAEQCRFMESACEVTAAFLDLDLGPE